MEFEGWEIGCDLFLAETVDLRAKVEALDGMLSGSEHEFAELPVLHAPRSE